MTAAPPTCCRACSAFIEARSVRTWNGAECRAIIPILDKQGRNVVAPNYQASDRGPEYHGFMVDHALLTQAKRLSPADRLDLIGELWQSLNHEDLPITDAEKSLLDERLAEANADPLAGRSWEDVEAELRQRLPR